MGLHNFFKKSIKGEKNSSITEASGTDIDTSFSKGTIKDNLSNFFEGMTSGIMVPSALTAGKIPSWGGSDTITYPFVGIVGYSTHNAVTSTKSRQKSYMDDFFGTLISDPKIKGVLSNVETRGIPYRSFIFYPNVPINTVGSGRASRSLSIFFPTVMSAAVQTKLGSYSVQQCLDIDENGNLFVNESKNPTTVFYPIRKSSKYSALAVSKMTIDDLMTVVANIGGKNELVSLLTTAFRSFLSFEIKRVNGESVSANPTSGNIDEFNPNAGKFFEFFKEINPSITDERIDSILKTNPNALLQSFVKWLNANSEMTICDKLLKKYYFPTPFDNTYCMRVISDMGRQPNVDYDSVMREYDVYKACIDNASSDTAMSIIRSANGVSDEPSSDNSSAQTAQPTSSGAELDSRDMKTSLMEMCRLVASGNHSSTFCFNVREDTSEQRREDGTVIVSHEGLKRTFIRILYSSVAFNELDKKFLSGTTDKFVTTPFSLDYTELFERFKNQIDQNAPKKFNCFRISGYTITYSYDSDAEEGLDKNSPNYISDLLDSYVGLGNVPLSEPASFSLVYFKDGDFISSGYDKNFSAGIAEMGTQKIPQSLRKDRRGVDEDRIRSQFIYSNKRVNLLNSGNRNIVKIQPKRHSISK